jgi:endoglucanase
MGHRRSPMGYRSLVAIVGAALLAAGPVAGSPAAGAAPPAIHGVVRLDQVGYATGEAKRAFLLAEAPVGTPRFAVVDDAGRTVFTGRVGRRTGGWNGRYRAVHRIDFGALRRPGRYRIVVHGLAAASPAFRVATRHDLFGKLVDDTVRFFQVQRDGAQVPRRLDRRPSHLTDRHATAYSAAELLLVQRGLHREDHALAAETRHGLRWLDKVWDERHKVLYAQVGLGTGSERFGFVGDHDVWRLPEADDALRVRPGDDEYFIKYRPVFRAAPPGARISPNLAGRVAAAFALGAQVEARRDHQRARALLRAAASVFAMARTTRVGELVTAYPHAYYPEDSWQDDMEFGAVELALAARKLHDRRAAGWLRAATHWARAYLGSEDREALNLYDTSALAHGDLVRALRRTPGAPGFEVSPRDLVGDLRRQLETGAGPARGEPFGSAVDVTQFDAATRTFGYAATARMYRRLTGDRSYDAFGTSQRNWALGANAWGTSFVIGEGTTFPNCPQHQVANLAGSLTGGRDVLVGAVVNGPNGAENFEDIGIPDGARACPVDGRNRYAAYDRPDARFLDDVRAWPSVEPAIDFTSTGMLAFALAAAPRG